MLPTEQLWTPARRLPILAASATAIALIALADWWTTPYFSLGLLYLFPIMIAAGCLPRIAIVALGVLCSILSELFSALDPAWRMERIVLQTLALAGCGLFVSELLRNRRLFIESRQRLRALVETSAAAIVTLDADCTIELANQAAVTLLLAGEGRLVGQSIIPFLPDLAGAMRAAKDCVRVRIPCQGRRANGDAFFAKVWYSSYSQSGALKFAAIIADGTEDLPAPVPVAAVTAGAGRPVLNPRQAAVLKLVLEGLSNRQISERLQMTTSAVKNTLQQLLSKTGSRNRSQMVCVALESYRDLL